jgi:hypothetical protein
MAERGASKLRRPRGGSTPTSPTAAANGRGATNRAPEPTPTASPPGFSPLYQRIRELSAETKEIDRRRLADLALEAAPELLRLAARMGWEHAADKTVIRDPKNRTHAPSGHSPRQAAIARHFSAQEILAFGHNLGGGREAILYRNCTVDEIDQIIEIKSRHAYGLLDEVRRQTAVRARLERLGPGKTVGDLEPEVLEEAWNAAP